jgi:hypothetical protein
MKNNQIVYPSNCVDSTLPHYVVENYSKFVEFMTSSLEANESIGFGKHLLLNLQTYQSFQTYKDKIIQYSYLDTDITKTSETIPLTSYKGFPEENGVVLIDNEIIFYAKIEENGLTLLKRGASATTVLPTFTTPGSFVDSVPAYHKEQTKVYNLSVLFMVAMLDNIHQSFAPGIDASSIHEGVNHSLLLSNIRDFFLSKGNKLGIQAVFKMIFGLSNVDVKYPGDQMIIPSESTWARDRICKSASIPRIFYDPLEIPGSPYGLTGYFAELRSYNSQRALAKFAIEFVTSYINNGDFIYDMVIGEGDFSGDFLANPLTNTTKDISSTDNVITVDSTESFPDFGFIFIDNEKIYYSSKSVNQFFGCKRGQGGTQQTAQESGSNVNGPYYVYGTYPDSDGNIITTRSWPTGVISSVTTYNPGSLHTQEDIIQTGLPGNKDLKSVLLESFSINENVTDEFASAKNEEVGDIGSYTYGVNGIYYDEKMAYIVTNELPDYPIGPFSDSPNASKVVANTEVHSIIKTNFIGQSDGNDSKKFGKIGLFVDGVPAYSNIAPSTLQRGKFDVRVSSNDIQITNPGSGYVNPTVIIGNSDDTDKTEAKAVLNKRGEVIGIQIIKSATYKTLPKINITSGNGAEINITVNRSGNIIQASVGNGGANYLDPPTLRVVDPDRKGRGASLRCTVEGGRIKDVFVDDDGDNYSIRSYVNIKPVGGGATATAIMGVFNFELDYKIKNTLDGYNYDDGNGMLFPDENNRLTHFGYLKNPIKLREKLNDDGTRHSPILGWAYDGNPIYGPFVNGDDGKTRAMRSSYRLLSNRDSFVGISPTVTEYPMGTFIEDYEYVPGLGDLDEHNGKVCNTPEFPRSQYPKGVYCYFLTLNGSESVYPHIIGSSFKNDVIPQNKTTLDNVTRYRNNNTKEIGSDIDVRVSQTSRGNISDLFVQDPGSPSSSRGDFAYFDDMGTGGGGSLAKVSAIRGQNIQSVEGSYITSRLISHHQRISLSQERRKDELHFIPGFVIETTSGARGVVEKYYGADYDGNDEYASPYVLIVNVITPNLIIPGDKFKDGRGIRVTVGRSGSFRSTTTFGESVSAGITEKPVSKESNVTLFSYAPPTSRYDKSSLGNGDIWFSLQNGKLYVYYNDGNTSQWVTAQPYGIMPIGTTASSLPIGVSGVNFIPSGTAPSSGRVVISDTAPTIDMNIGDLWWSPVTGILYVWNTDDDGRFVTCNCEFEGVPIEISQEWICTDPTGSVPNYEGGAAPTPPTQPTNSTVTTMRVFVSAANPGVKPDGSLWWSSDTGKMYIRFDNTWVASSPTSATPSGFWASMNDDGQSSDSEDQIYGPLALLPEDATKETLFFDTLCDFYPGDSVSFLPNGISIGERSSIKTKETNMRGGSMRCSRDSNSIELPDASVLRNETKFKIRLETEEPHRVKVGDIVYFDSTDSSLDQVPFNVIDAGYIDSAKGTANIDAQGRVQSVTILYGGKGYPRDFEVGFIGGNGGGARGTANVKSGVIVSVTMTNKGRNYTSSPEVTFLDKCNWRYFTVYSDKPYLGDLSGKIKSYWTDSDSSVGYVLKFDLQSGGTGYSKLPTVPGIYKRLSDRCEVSVSLSGTAIDEVVVVKTGNRYVNPVALVLDDNPNAGGAVLMPVVGDGRIDSVKVIEGGMGYENPQIIFYEPAKLIPVGENIGRINAFQVDNPGRNISSNESDTPSILVEFKLILLEDQTDTPMIWQKGEKVYQANYKTREAEAYVNSWDSENQILSVIKPVGYFESGSILRSFSDPNKKATILQCGQSEQSLVIKGSSRAYGTFLNTKSFIGDRLSNIQDSFFYQNFSYVVDAPLQRGSYNELIKKLVHPAGFICFSEVNIQDMVTCPCKEEDFDLVTYYQDLFSWVVPITPIPPIDPSAGDLWCNSVDGTLSIYYVGDIGEWIAAGTAGALYTK